MSESQRIDYAPMPEVSKIIFDAGVTTKASEKHPDRNEDACLINLTNRTFGIFDGMGGIANGKDAANISSKTFQYSLSFIDTNHTSPPVIQEKLITIFNQANKFVLEQQKVVGSNMGSTATVAAVISSEPGEYQLCAIHVGDSRIYVLRDGVLKRVTTDHNIIHQEDPQNYDYHQNILDNFDGTQALTPIQKTFYQGRSGISRFIGNPTSKPDFYNIKLKSGDVVLLTSDGVHDNLTTNQLATLINQNKNLPAESISNQIIQKSTEVSRGQKIRSKSDDMTAMIIKIDQGKSGEIKKPQETLPRLPEQFNPKISQTINVQRSSGFIESGWEIYEINKKERMILVKKRTGRDLGDNSLFNFKKIEYDLAERLNRQSKPEDIAKAENFGQLLFTLKNLPGVQGSQDFYTSESLINLIQSIINGEKSLEFITRGCGLREAVKRCLAQKHQVH